MKYVTLTCLNCNKVFDKLKSELSKNNFCSCSCSVSYSNRFRKSFNILVTCTSCSIQESARYNVNKKNFKCNSCRKHLALLKRITSIQCSRCSKHFSGYKRRKYCNECLFLVQQESGIKSIIVQKEVRRSKNEILFYDLCLKEFVNVTNNDNIFSGWDADVLLHDVKVAVLWNGPWHYVYCGGKHRLKQVQSRDIIKLQKIKESGWTSYIIKDYDNSSNGKFSKEFVEQEFLKFKDWLKEKV